MTSAPGAPPLPAGDGRVELRDVTLRLRRRTSPCCDDVDLDRRGRAAPWRSSAPTGVRQVDAGDAAAAALRRRPRASVLVDGADVRERRRGVAAARGRPSSPTTRSCSPPACARTSPTRGRTRASEEVRAGRAPRRCRRVHRRACRRATTRAIGERGLHALGRPAPADRDRPGAARGPAHPDPRRRHLERRRHHREPHHTRAATS